MTFSYKIQGESIPFKGNGDFLKFDSKKGRIVRTESPLLNSAPRIVKLKTFNSVGDENEVFVKLKFGGSPNYPVKIVTVTRKKFFDIVGQISAKKNISQKIIQEWKRQSLHYLNGGKEPLKDEAPNLEIHSCLEEQNNSKEYISIFQSMRDEIFAQVVDSNADENDLLGLEPLIREFRVTVGAR